MTLLIRGESRLCGTNQIVFLHGGTLARYDIKSGKEVWSQVLVTKQQIADAVARENQMQPTGGSEPRIPQSQLEEMAVRDLEGSLQLHVSGENVWVAAPEKLTHYDWNTGKVLQEIPLAAGAGELIARNGEFLIMGEGANGQALITHINPATGESRVEEIGQAGTDPGRRDSAERQRRQPGRRRPAVGTGHRRGKANEPGKSRGTGATFEPAGTDCLARLAGQQLGAGTPSSGTQ